MLLLQVRPFSGLLSESPDLSQRIARSHSMRDAPILTQVFIRWGREREQEFLTYLRKLVSKQERDSKREMRERGEKAKISQVDFTTVADPSEWL